MSKQTELLRAAHACVKREEWIRAWDILNDVLNEQPDHPETLYLMGCVMRGIGNIGLAYMLFRRALAGDQRQINLWMSYAATLHDLNRYDEAREALTVAGSMYPNDDMPIANIAATYVQEGDWREAINWCNKALAINPDNHIARISRNFAYLSLGRWKDGWEDAAWLYGRHLGVRVYNPPEYEEPTWDGSKGKIVVVQADQGVGDIIMFAQCLNDVARDCREVILETAPRLVDMMRRNFPAITVEGTLKSITQGWALERIGTDRQIEAHIHISHLGRFYRNKDADFPRTPYMQPDPEHVAFWAEKLAQHPRPWVGIAWQGGIQSTQTHLRSMNLVDLAPVILEVGKAGGTVFDLSYQDNRHEVSLWNIDNAEQIVYQEVNADNFEATLSFIAAMDEVVSVTTTVAHVCGAIGKFARIMVPSVPQWRYAYRCGDGMVWYPEDSVRLYRQKPGEQDWSFCVQRVAKDLHDSPALRRKQKIAA